MALGMIYIKPNEIGIIERKFGSRRRPGQLIALNGEAGYQADILPSGYHVHPVMSEVHRYPLVEIPQGEIGLVIANDGQPRPSGQRLGRMVDCNNFQNARAFLEKGGQKGEQLGILKAALYQIHPILFTVITSANATEHGMNPEQFKTCKIEQGKIGIVKTKDGPSLPSGEIAGRTIQGHQKFQSPQKFLDNGGYRGLQEEVITGDELTLNPWFVEIVKQVPFTEIPTGTVGVVVSSVGKNSPNPSNIPVENSYKGVRKEPIYPGKYPINTEVIKIIKVPTSFITLEWSNKPKQETSYDANLQAIQLLSKDGYNFNIEVTQVIRIKAESTPQLVAEIISSSDDWQDSLDIRDSNGIVKYNSIKHLVHRVLERTVENGFRLVAKESNALDWLYKRDEKEEEARDYIRDKLDEYKVEFVNCCINKIDFPSLLQEKLTIRDQIDLQAQRTALAQQQAQTNNQDYLVRQLYQIDIQQKKESLRLQILGHEMQLMGGYHNWLAWKKVEQLPQLPVPKFLSVGGNSQNNGILEAFVAPMLDTASSNAFSSSSLPESPNLPQLESSPPRCPVILLLDTSYPLSGDYLTQLHKGLQGFQNAIVSHDHANRTLEIITMTFSDSVQIVQSTLKEQEFTAPNLQLGGSSVLGQGLEKALKLVENTKNRYQKTNLQGLKPWIFLILGSHPQDNWQITAQKMQTAIAQKQLNVLAIGVQGIDEAILQHITPNHFILQDLKFQSLFYWFAIQIKGMSKKYALSQFATIIAFLQTNLPEQQAKTLEEKMDLLITEASKPRPDRSIYSPIIAEIRQIARSLGDIGKPLLEMIPLITQTIEFRH